MLQLFYREWYKSIRVRKFSVINSIVSSSFKISWQIEQMYSYCHVTCVNKSPDSPELMAITVGPAPERNTALAPAVTAASISGFKCGYIFSARCGWWSLKQFISDYARLESVENGFSTYLALHIASSQYWTSQAHWLTMPLDLQNKVKTIYIYCQNRLHPSPIA